MIFPRWVVIFSRVLRRRPAFRADLFGRKGKGRAGENQNVG